MVSSDTKVYFQKHKYFENFCFWRLITPAPIAALIPVDLPALDAEL